MAEQKDSNERTEQPTAKRLEDARKKGQVPRSPDLGAAAVSIAAAGAIYLFGTKTASALLEMMTQGLTISHDDLSFPDIVTRDFAQSAINGALAIVPLIGATIAAAIAAPMVIGGWNFSTESMAFKGERLDPIKGFGRMFSIRSAVELIKSIAKFLFVGGVGVVVIYSDIDRITSLARLPVEGAVLESAEILALAFLAMTGALGVIALIDAPFQMMQFRKEMRMTREEIREEYKETDGNPENKARVRGVQMQLSRSRMMQEIPRATVIVTNPTHFAVALRYQEGRDSAPVVVAKGADEVAARIRDIGAEHSVPLVSAPPLARVLFRYVEIGQEVPGALYVAVAQVLTYVFKLRNAVRYGADKPELPVIDPAIESVGSLGAGRR
jgi:flagellar biosynthetic protein FlhB